MRNQDGHKPVKYWVIVKILTISVRRINILQEFIKIVRQDEDARQCWIFCPNLLLYVYVYFLFRY